MPARRGELFESSASRVVPIGALLFPFATPAGALAMQVFPKTDDALTAAPVVQLESEPPAKLTVYPPIPSQLAEGRVVIQYKTDNLHIRPVFGAAALAVSPRIGHLHITVDGAPWRWLDASNEPVTVNGLPAGPHDILIELVDPTHKTIDAELVSFVVPSRPGPASAAPAEGGSHG